MIVKQELPQWLWLWFPVIILISTLCVYLYEPALARFIVGDEAGFFEPATAIVLLPAIYFGCLCFYHRNRIKFLPIRIWIGLVTLACIYIAGEEISWGQHLFNWQSPEVFREVNDQNETNIHNISSWFDQKPRLLLELWILVGGVCVPVYLWIKKRSLQDNNWPYWFWPTGICLPVALIAILVKMPERIDNYLNVEGLMFVRYSELQEFYFALFLFLYVYSFKKRLITHTNLH